jgi:hypothetical protein
LGFVFTCDEGSTTIGVVVLITEGLGFVVQLLKYKDPMGYAKVYEGNNFNKEEGVYELDILGSIISAPHDNDNLFHFPNFSISHWILVFKGVVTHINIQIQAINCPC